MKHKLSDFGIVSVAGISLGMALAVGGKHPGIAIVLLGCAIAAALQLGKV